MRYHLATDDHEYDFVDGALLWPAARGVKEVFGDDTDCYSFFDGSFASSILEAINALHDYAIRNGPFDGVIGFSQGAVLAATLIIAAQSESLPQTGQSKLKNPFSCAILLCGGLPFDMVALQENRVSQLTPKPGQRHLIDLPVVNSWAVNDAEYPGMGPPLSELCSARVNKESIHTAGHGVPSEGKELEDLVAAVEATLKEVRSRRRGD